MSKLFEVFVSEINPNLDGSPEFPMLAYWTEVFETSSERADYILDIVSQVDKFNARHNAKPVTITCMKVDNLHFTERVSITAVQS